LKENVIIGKLVPAGTGMNRYRTLDVQLANEVSETSDEKETVLID
jgi:DNA-directed RNA polymerase subunit beta'